jgi:hypothetical protein
MQLSAPEVVEFSRECPFEKKGVRDKPRRFHLPKRATARFGDRLETAKAPPHKADFRCRKESV